MAAPIPLDAPVTRATLPSRSRLAGIDAPSIGVCLPDRLGSCPMQISTILSYAGGFRESANQVVELEKAGLDVVWIAEAYGFDGPSMMGYLAALTERVQIGSAILPIYSRTP